MRYSWKLFLSLSIVLITTCSRSGQTNNQLITFEPTFDKNLVVNTPTLAQEFKITQTTTQPAHTPILTKKPKITSTATATALPMATCTPLPIDLAEASFISPDKKWTAYFFGYYRAQLDVVNSDKTILWGIYEGNFEGDEAFFVPYRWSFDSKFLYFNTHVSIDGYVPFYDGMGLRRLDVSTGDILEILPSHYVSDGSWRRAVFSLSEKEKKLAYVNNINGEALLVIREMETNNEISLALKGFSDAGSILWSPNQDQLVLGLSKGDNWEDTIFFIGTVDISSLTLSVHVQDSETGIDPIKWVNNNEILIQERGESTLLLNLKSNDLQIMPTITPFP